MPLELICPLPDAPSRWQSPAQYVVDLQRRLNDAYTAVFTHLDRAHRRAKTEYDYTAKASSFTVGQFVWLHCQPPAGVSAKLFRHWDGPWQVSKVHSPLVYSIKRLGLCPTRRSPVLTVQRNRLKKVVGPVATPTSQAPVEVGGACPPPFPGLVAPR